MVEVDMVQGGHKIGVMRHGGDSVSKYCKYVSDSVAR